jgi:hypothetical protein
VSNQTIEVEVGTPEARTLLQICVECGFAFHATVKGSVLTINITGF